MQFRSSNPLLGCNGGLCGQEIGLQSPYRSSYISEPMAFPTFSGNATTTAATTSSAPSIWMSLGLLAAGFGFGYVLARVTEKPTRTTNPRKKKNR